LLPELQDGDRVRRPGSHD